MDFVNTENGIVKIIFLRITLRKLVQKANSFESLFQEVIHGPTPPIVPETDSYPVQKLKDRTTRVEEFKR